MNIDKVEEIFKAWGIALTIDKNDPRFELAFNRIQICDACEFKSMIAIGPIDLLARCNVCGCALKGKIYTERTYADGVNPDGTPNTDHGSCPKSKWMEIEKQYLDSQQINNEN